MIRIQPWFLVLIVLIALAVITGQNGVSRTSEVSYTTFTQLVKEQKVEAVNISGSTATVKLRAPEQVATLRNGTREAQNLSVILVADSGLPDNALIADLKAADVQITRQQPSPWWGFLMAFGPVLLLVALFYFVFMRAQGGQSQVFQFGQSRAKRYGKENKVPTKFSDVAGHEEAKRELVEVVDFLKNPTKYHQIGAEIPKGVLLVGPPGTGKTLLARAVAGEADVPFFTVSASEFMEMFVGVGASRVRTLFDEARKGAPAIIFIDEIDSIGRKRGAGIGGGHDEREQTLNQILSEMDGFDKTSSVIVLAATNRPDILDPALLRPGRFDRQVTIDLPNLKEREAILKVHMRNKPIAEDVSLDELSRATSYFSGADLKNLVNEAALEAGRVNKTRIEMHDFYRALDKITLGLENSSLTITEEERKAIAYHEAGHAVAAAVLPGTDRLQKVSIIPRGRALGAAFYLPEERAMVSQQKLENQLVYTLGGRAAEEIFIGQISTGASNDFKQAMGVAKRMVLEWGMGENFRNMAFGSDSGPVFLGEDMAHRKDFSESTARLVDEDIKKILDTAYERARSVLSEYAPAMHEVAKLLLESELITGDTVREVVKRNGRSTEAFPSI